MSSLVDSPSTTDPHGNSHESGCAGCLDRRQVLVRAGLVTMGVAAAGVLAACGGGSASSGNDSPRTAADGALAKVSDIPVGGAISATGADGKPIILTQPKPGRSSRCRPSARTRAARSHPAASSSCARATGRCTT